MYGRFFVDFFGGFLGIFGGRMFGSEAEGSIGPIGGSIGPIGGSIGPIGGSIGPIG